MSQSNTFDASTLKLDDGDLIQQLGLLGWLWNGEEAKELLKLVTAARVGYTLYDKVSNKKKIQLYQAQCYLGIADFLKKNPRATKEQITQEVVKHVEIFKTQIK